MSGYSKMEFGDEVTTCVDAHMNMYLYALSIAK